MAAGERLAGTGPLAARLRPRSLDEVVGQRHLVGPGGALRTLAEQDRLSSVILWGPPGSGKTTLAMLLASWTTKEFIGLSAVNSGVKEVREVIDGARRRLGESGRGTMLFLDEVHRFNKAQQDLLLPSVEEGLVTLVGATTENPYFEVNAPLLSRSTLWRLEPLSDDDLDELIDRGLAAEEVGASDEARLVLARAADGDARALLTTLEVAAALSRRHLDADGSACIELQDVVDARDGRVLHQGADEHYDQVSAMIKSVRGSDPDAGLYWLHRLLEAGESPRFIARRLVILASEDVGMADPMSLVLAESAARAVEFVGMPEAALTLSQALLHLATAPKSNSVLTAMLAARNDVTTGPSVSVPEHLRDAHYAGAGELGHGQGYRYPHDDPSGWIQQRYLPVEMGDRSYYRPSSHGREGTVVPFAEAAAGRERDPEAPR